MLGYGLLHCGVRVWKGLSQMLIFVNTQYYQIFIFVYAGIDKLLFIYIRRRLVGSIIRINLIKINKVA
jgi:hypothetical protein